MNAFVALKDGNETNDQIRKDLVLQVRKSIGPFAAPKTVFVVDDLPKTRSGKIMRRILRKILSGEEDSLGDTSTVSKHSVPLLNPITYFGSAIRSQCSRQDHCYRSSVAKEVEADEEQSLRSLGKDGTRP